MHKTPKRKFNTPFKTPKKHKGLDFVSQQSTPGFEVRDILPHLSQLSYQSSMASQSEAVLEESTGQLPSHSEEMKTNYETLQESGYQSFNIPSSKNAKKEQTAVTAKKWAFKKAQKSVGSENVPDSKMGERNKKANKGIKDSRDIAHNTLSFPGKSAKFSGIKEKVALCYTPKKGNDISMITSSNSRPKKHSTPKRKFGFHKEQAVPEYSPIVQTVAPAGIRQHQKTTDMTQISDVYEFELSPESEVKIAKQRRKLAKQRLAKKHVVKVIDKMHREIQWWKENLKQLHQRKTVSGHNLDSQGSQSQNIPVRVTCASEAIDSNYFIRPGTSILQDDKISFLESYKP